ncbi:MAG: DUF4097 family beta strand repeat-containing protein [Oscillospiraceae bacterium]
MSKKVKISLIVAAALLLAGALIFGASLLLGAYFPPYVSIDLNGSPRIRVEQGRGSDGRWGIGWHGGQQNGQGNQACIGASYPKPSLENDYSPSGEYAVSAKGVSSLCIEWVAGEVEIEPWDGDDIVFSENSTEEITEEYALSWSGRGDTLRISCCDGTDCDGLPEKNLLVLIPRALAEKLGSLKCDFAAASADIEGLAAENVLISTVSGEVDFSGAAEKLALSSVSGEVGLELKRLPSDLSIDSVSADIDLELPEDAGFRLNFDTVTGKIQSEQDLTAVGDCYTVGDGKANFNISTVSASLKISCLED